MTRPRIYPDGRGGYALDASTLSTRCVRSLTLVELRALAGDIENCIACHIESVETKPRERSRPANRDEHDAEVEPAGTRDR